MAEVAGSQESGSLLVFLMKQANLKKVDRVINLYICVYGCMEDLKHKI